MSFLEGVGVLEVYPTVATAMVGRYLADIGARVTVVEPPGGSALRSEPPFAPGGESLLFAYLAGGKECLGLDAAGPEDAAELRRRASGADLVVHALPAAEYQALLGEAAGARSVSVRPFGQAGPRGAEEAGELSVAAASGLLWMTGFPEARPVLSYGHQPSYFPALGGVVAALAAILDSRPVRAYDVSQQEALAAVLEDALIAAARRGTLRGRLGNMLPKTGPLTEVYSTRDGAVATCVYIEPQWENLCLAVDRPEWRDDARFASWPLRAANGAPIRERLTEWCGERTSAEAFATLQEFRIPTAILESPAGLLDEAQARERDAFVGVPLAGAGIARAPGLPIKAVDAAPTQGRPAAAGGAARTRLDLSRVRVLDLTQAWAGPFATQQLADLGMDVIKVESALRVDQVRLGTAEPGTAPSVDMTLWFQQYNRNKRSLSLEVSHPEGYELFMRLVAAADVVIDNFSARVMPHLRLDFARLSAANPRIVQVRLTGFGLAGPYRDSVAYGESLEAASGLTYLTRSGGRPVRSGIAYPDVVGGYHGAIAVLAGLAYRERTGRGVLLDVAERDATMRLVGEAIVEASVRGETWVQESSEHPAWAPRGVYRCRGVERWLAITCRDETAWAGLAGAIGAGPELTALPVEGRRERREEVDAAIEAWTVGQDRDAAAAGLRVAGVEAEPVRDLLELLREPQLAGTGFLEPIPHPSLGAVVFPGPPMLRDGARLPVHHAPLFGEHTDEVLREMLSLPDAEVERLAAAGAIRRTPRFD